MTNRISVIGANSTLSPVLFGVLLLHQNEAVVKINLALSWAFVSKILHLQGALPVVVLWVLAPMVLLDASHQERLVRSAHPTGTVTPQV